MNAAALTKEFDLEVEGTTIPFVVEYDLQTHSFQVSENGKEPYRLLFNMENKSWSTSPEGATAVPVEELALKVQQSFGIFV